MLRLPAAAEPQYGSHVFSAELEGFSYMTLSNLVAPALSCGGRARVGSNRRRAQSRPGRGLIKEAARLYRQAALTMAARRHAASGSTVRAVLELHAYMVFPWLCCHEASPACAACSKVVCGHLNALTETVACT